MSGLWMRGKDISKSPRGEITTLMGDIWDTFNARTDDNGEALQTAMLYWFIEFQNVVFIRDFGDEDAAVGLEGGVIDHSAMLR